MHCYTNMLHVSAGHATNQQKHIHINKRLKENEKWDSNFKQEEVNHIRVVACKIQIQNISYTSWIKIISPI